MRILTRIMDWFATPYSLYLLLKDPDISLKAKLKGGLILLAVAFYILDPWDIIPDVIPLVGWLDDLVVVPLIMSLVSRIVPEVNIIAIQNKARTRTRNAVLWTIAAILAMGIIGLTALGSLIYLVIKLLS